MIPFLDLQQLNSRFEQAFEKEFKTFLKNGQYVLGDPVQSFEDSFANYCGATYCVGVGNGLDALRLILEGSIALGKLHKGDKVLVAANTYIATILAIKHAGLKPILIEPSEDSFNISIDQIEKYKNTDVKAVMVTYLYGLLADMESIDQIATKEGWLLFADAAQAHGASNKNGQKAGSLCDAAAFSFYPSKNLGALGDAGAITTSDQKLAKLLFKLRNYGTTTKYVNELVGYNSRLDTLQAIFLSVKLPFLDADNVKRREIAERYIRGINNPKIQLPKWDFSDAHVFHVFVVRVKERQSFCAYLLKNGIGSLLHYPIPPHKQEALPEYNDLDFPITALIHQEVVSIPLHPLLSEESVTHIINLLNGY